MYIDNYNQQQNRSMMDFFTRPRRRIHLFIVYIGVSAVVLSIMIFSSDRTTLSSYLPATKPTTHVQTPLIPETRPPPPPPPAMIVPMPEAESKHEEEKLMTAPEVDLNTPREQAANATLGFQKLLVLSTKESWRTRGLLAAAELTGLNFTIPPQPPNFKETIEGFMNISPAGDKSRPHLGSAAAWLAHIDLLKHIIASDLETAFIVEDDVDWDVRIKDQMRLISDNVRVYNKLKVNVTVPLPEVPAEMKFETELKVENEVLLTAPPRPDLNNKQPPGQRERPQGGHQDTNTNTQAKTNDNAHANPQSHSNNNNNNNNNSNNKENTNTHHTREEPAPDAVAAAPHAMAPPAPPSGAAPPASAAVVAIHNPGPATPAKHEPSHPETSSSPQEDDNTPYGTSWDVLWLGHCGSLGHNDTNHRRPLAYLDDMRIASSSFNGWSKKYFLESIPEHMRVIHESSMTICTFGYAVSRTGVRNVLKHVMKGGYEAFDVALHEHCKSGRLKCLAVSPTVFHHYEPSAAHGYVSPVREGDGKGKAKAEKEFEGFMGSTANIEVSARCEALWGKTCLRGP